MKNYEYLKEKLNKADDYLLIVQFFIYIQRILILKYTI